MKKSLRLIFFILGLAGLLLLIKGAGLNDADWQTLFSPRFFLELGGQLLLWAGIFALHSGIYLNILGEDAAQVGFANMYKICLAGVALNNVTPAGLFGGEPYRILELEHFVSKEKAASSTLTFSLLYTLGHAMLWATGAVVYLCFGCPGEWGISLVILLSGFFALLFCTYFFLKKKGGIVLPCLRALAKLPLLKKPLLKLLDKNAQLLADIDAGISAFREEPKRFRLAVLQEYVSRLAECLEYLMILRYLELATGFFGAVLVMSTASLLANLLFIVPMQAGTREGGTALAVRWLGGDEALGLMTGLLFRIREMITTGIGLFFILVEKKRVKKNG